MVHVCVCVKKREFKLLSSLIQNEKAKIYFNPLDFKYKLIIVFKRISVTMNKFTKKSLINFYFIFAFA